MKKYIIVMDISIILLITLICCISIMYTKNYEIVDNVGNNEHLKIIDYKMSQKQIENLPSCKIGCQSEEQEENVGKDQVCENNKLDSVISYTGEMSEIRVGNYKGLTYYSQLDERWVLHPYTSTGNLNQTIGSSGCGPTCGAMIVTATKGVMTPPEMGDLFVKFGYRSENSGTYLSAFGWIADTFGIEYKETYSLDEAIKLLKNNYYVVVSCSEGLFTTGGHIILIVGLDDEILKIYDPYLYSGKFDSESRKDKIKVEGYNLYCLVDNFKKYANYTRFFAYKHDIEVPENNSKPIITGNIMYVSAKNGLNVRNSPNGKKIDAIKYGTQVIVYKIRNGWGKIGKNRWVSMKYLTNTVEHNNNSINNNNSSIDGNNSDKDNTLSSDDKNYTTGRYKVLARVLNVRTGPSLKYRIKKYYQLTNNARTQNIRLGYGRTNGFRRGVICDVTRVKGEWGLTPSGWICLKYCQKI